MAQINVVSDDADKQQNYTGVHYMTRQEIDVLETVWTEIQKSEIPNLKLSYQSHVEFLHALNAEAFCGEEGVLFSSLMSYIDNQIDDLKFLNISVIHDLCALLRRTDDPDFTETSLASVCCVSGQSSTENVIISDRNVAMMLSKKFAPFAQAYWLLKHGWVKSSRDTPVETVLPSSNFSNHYLTSNQDELPCEMLVKALLCVMHSLIVTRQNM